MKKVLHIISITVFEICRRPLNFIKKERMLWCPSCKIKKSSDQVDFYFNKT